MELVEEHKKNQPLSRHDYIPMTQDAEAGRL